MALLSGLFFSGVYLFSFCSICWWVYLACAHDGAGAYAYLSGHRSDPFPAHSIPSIARKHFGLVSILICFILFLYALCVGFSAFFSWIPDQYHLTLGDGSVVPLSTLISCLVGICSSLVFGKWVFIGICSYWEKRALAAQTDLYFEVIHCADSVGDLGRVRQETIQTIKNLREKNTPEVVCSRLDLCVRVIDLRIEDLMHKKGNR
jgi:hypothetical protein